MSSILLDIVNNYQLCDAVSQIHDYEIVEHYPIECIPVFKFSAKPLRVAAKALKNDTRVS
jgi:hypothetical protein